MVLLLLAIKTPAQQAEGYFGPYGSINYDSRVPLLIFTNGGGTIFLSYPFHAGGMYRVGREYEAVAIPDRGYVFVGWNIVNVFTSTEYTVDPGGNLNPPMTSTVLSSVPGYYMSPEINLIVEPEDLLIDEPGVMTITEGRGWQANFVKRRGWTH